MGPRTSSKATMCQGKPTVCRISFISARVLALSSGLCPQAAPSEKGRKKGVMACRRRAQAGRTGQHMRSLEPALQSSTFCRNHRLQTSLEEHLQSGQWVFCSGQGMRWGGEVGQVSIQPLGQ